MDSISKDLNLESKSKDILGASLGMKRLRSTTVTMDTSLRKNSRRRDIVLLLQSLIKAHQDVLSPSLWSSQLHQANTRVTNNLDRMLNP